MNNGVKFTGMPSWEELKSTPGVPGLERLEKGPVAFIECVQNIPCNPCEKACPFGAITVGQPITSLPVLHQEKCTGCGLCIPACPGLAIFRVHLNYTDTTSLVEFPYEYYPLPDEGDTVPCGNRAGQFLSNGRVVKIKNPKANDGTTIISVEVPKEYCLEVRTISNSGE